MNSQIHSYGYYICFDKNGYSVNCINIVPPGSPLQNTEGTKYRDIVGTYPFLMTN